MCRFVQVLGREFGLGAILSRLRMQGVVQPRTSPLNLSFPNPVSCSSDGTAFCFSAPKWQRQFCSLKQTFPLRGKYDKKSAFVIPSRSWKLAIARASDNGGLPIAPLQPESPTGQFLVQLLVSHPHLVPAAAEQQLDKLAKDREAEIGQEQSCPKATELVLSRRIAELKAHERRVALQETIYALIVQKFVEVGVSMVPRISSLSESERVDALPVKDKELESVHSTESLEMIREHLILVLGGRGTADYLDQSSVAQISKLRVGQVYAASVMYGYFLRRVDQHFQLEKTMNILPADIDKSAEAEQADRQQKDSDKKDHETIAAEVAAAVAVLSIVGGMKQDLNSAGFTRVGIRPSKLRSYVMSFDVETLHRYAVIRSKESVSLIEKHTEALFGRPDIQVLPDGSMAVAKDEIIRLSFGGLRRLVLEAVAFGTFLWDVESYVDSLYGVVAH
eukprot:c20411_g1_i1 orf=127-1470(+)